MNEFCERNAMQWPRWFGTQRDGFDGRAIVTRNYETDRSGGDDDRSAHNPEVATMRQVPESRFE